MIGAGPAYRADIDGLRALAVGLVVVFHAAPSLLPGGFIGVDVFFVISGYLITGIIAKEALAGRFSLVRFYVRRVRRIIPALVLVLLATVALGLLVLPPADLVKLGWHAIAGALFASNFLLLSEVGYFDAGAHAKPLLHLWSLAVEEQFYLVWPFAIVLALRAKRAGIWCLAALAGLSFLLALYWAQTRPEAGFFMLPSRLWELAAGGLLALGAIQGKPRGSDEPGLWAELVCLSALLALVAASVLIGPGDAYPSYRALAPVLATVALIHYLPSSTISRVFVSWRPVVLLGLISYPLYLWHWPLLVLGEYAGAGMAAGEKKLFTVFLVGLSVLLSFATWKLVELPVQAWGRTIDAGTTRRMLKGGAAALLVCGLAGTVMVAANGFPQRIAPQYRAALDDLDPFREKWDGWVSTLEACGGLAVRGDGLRCAKEPGLQDDAISVVVLGDSHGLVAMHGLAAALPEAEGVAYLGRNGCPPLLGVDVSGNGGVPTGCDAVMAAAVDWLAAHPGVEVVLLASRGALYVEGKDLDPSTGIRRNLHADGRRVPASRRVEVFAQGTQAMVDALASRGIRTVVLGPVPELEQDPGFCVARPWTQAPASDCLADAGDVARRQAGFLEAISRIRRDGRAIELVQMSPHFCTGDMCGAFLEDRLVYRDNNHLNLFGARLMGAHIANGLKGADAR